MVSRTAIPKELSVPGMERALRLVETVLFGSLCAQPDPSLAWLLEKEPRSLAWVQGPPSLPDFYTLRRGDEWLSYAGGTQRGLLRKPSEPEMCPGYRSPHGLGPGPYGAGGPSPRRGGRPPCLDLRHAGRARPEAEAPAVVDGRLDEPDAVVWLSHEQAFDGDLAALLAGISGFSCGLRLSTWSRAVEFFRGLMAEIDNEGAPESQP